MQRQIGLRIGRQARCQIEGPSCPAAFVSRMLTVGTTLAGGGDTCRTQWFQKIEAIMMHHMAWLCVGTQGTVGT